MTRCGLSTRSNVLELSEQPNVPWLLNVVSLSSSSTNSCACILSPALSNFIKSESRHSRP